MVAVETNYRSAAPILEVANAVLDAGDLGGVRLLAFRDGGAVPKVTGYANEDDESVAVSRAILDAKLPSTSWGQQAVLARTNQQLDAVEAALQASHIPTRVRGRVPFHELPAVRAALREFTAPGATLADAVGRLAALADAGRGDPDADFDAATEAGGDGDALVQLLAYADQYRQLPRADAAGFRAWLVQEADDTIGGDGVELVTFHGAKGREWPAVHIVGVEDGLVPIAWATTDAEKAEERRLFYVAVTRAEDQLSITWSASRRRAGGRSGDAVALAVPPRGRSRAHRARRAAAARRPRPHPACRRRHRRGPTATTPPAPRPSDGGGRCGRGRRASPTTPCCPSTCSREVARAFPADADDLARIPGTGPLVLAGLADEVLASLRG